MSKIAKQEKPYYKHKNNPWVAKKTYYEGFLLPVFEIYSGKVKIGTVNLVSLVELSSDWSKIDE